MNYLVYRFVRDVPTVPLIDGERSQKLWRLATPIKWGMGSSRWILTSAVRRHYHGQVYVDEVMAFLADKSGSILNFSDIACVKPASAGHEACMQRLIDRLGGH